MKKLLVIYLCGLGLLISPSVYSGSFSITPTRLVLSATQPVATLNLTNPDDASAFVQVQVKQWMQQNGQDKYYATNEILAVPPMVELPPHQTQVIRFAVRNKIGSANEQAYRVYLHEIVPQVKHLSSRMGSRLTIALNVSLPLFVEPASPQQKFVWLAKWIDSEHLQLMLRNVGNVTLFMNQWQLFSTNKPVSAKKSTFSYIHPKQSQHWVLKAKQLKLPLDVNANINGQWLRTYVQLS